MHKSTRGLEWETEEPLAEDSRGNLPIGSKRLPVEEIDALGEVGKFRIEKGYEFSVHRHRDWGIVVVLRGSVQVTLPDEEKPTVYEAGDVYLVEPGTLHREIMLDDTEVVVIKGSHGIEDRFTTQMVDLAKE